MGPVQTFLMTNLRRGGYTAALLLICVVFYGLYQVNAPWWLYVNVLAASTASWFAGCATLDPNLPVRSN